MLLSTGILVSFNLNLQEWTEGTEEKGRKNEGEEEGRG